jgi:hypothetical protein
MASSRYSPGHSQFIRVFGGIAPGRSAPLAGHRLPGEKNLPTHLGGYLITARRPYSLTSRASASGSSALVLVHGTKAVPTCSCTWTTGRRFP